MIARLQGSNHRTLLLGSHAPKHVMILDRINERLGGQVFGQVARIHETRGRAVGRGQARLRGQRAHRRRVVARDDAHVHILGPEVVESLGRVGAQILLKDHESGNRTGRGKLVVGHSLVGVDEGHHAGTFRSDATHLREELRIGSRCLVNDELGGTQNPRLAPAPPRAPLAGRREGDGPLDALSGTRALRLAKVHPNGLRRRVGTIACRTRQSAEHRGLVTGDDLDAADANAAGGKRTRLVEAQAVHTREDLDGGKFLNEHTAACQRRRADREVHGSQEHQALRDHTDHRGDREDEGLAPVSSLPASDPILRVEG